MFVLFQNKFGVVQMTISQYDFTADIISIVDNYNCLLEHDGYTVDFTLISTFCYC